MKKILLVDGSNLLFQMFYGMPSVIIGKKGRPIQGTLGFVGGLLRMIRMVHPSHVAVFFDGEHHNDRTDLSPEYKANRPDYANIPEEDTPFSQLMDIYAALDLMGIVHKETEVCEADDWLAGYSYICPDDGEMVISSGDSDLFQLINDRVKILRYRGDNSVICDREYVINKLGVPPERYAEYKALTGDSSDNIRGCDKVGPKTAAALVSQFASLDELVNNADEISKPSVRKAVKECAERIKLNYKLIKLDNVRELPFSFDEMKYSEKDLTTRKVLDAIGI